MRVVLVSLIALFAATLAESAAASGQGPLAAGASARIEISFAPAAGLPEGFNPSLLDAFKVRGEMDFMDHRGQVSYGSGHWDTIYDGDASYSRMGLDQLIPGAKAWVRFDGGSDDLDPFDVQSQALELGPAQLLGWLRGGSGQLREAGSEIVSGTSTTRYSGTLDLEKVVENAPAADREDLRWVLDEMRKEEPSSGTVPYQVWVDARGLVHRLRFVEGALPFGLAVTVEFTDFDLRIVLDLPPASDVMGPDEFMQAMTAYADAHPSPGCGQDGTPATTETTSDNGDGGSVILCFRSSTEGGK